MTQAIKSLCIKAKAVKDNMLELDNNYNNLFYSTTAATISVNIEDYNTGTATTYSIDNFQKIKETTDTFTSELYSTQQFKALVNGVFIVANHMDRPFFVEDVAFVDNTEYYTNIMEIKDSEYNGSVLILKSTTTE